MLAVRTGLTALLVAGVVLLLAFPAVAGAQLEGEGYRLSLPSGFASLSASSLGDGLAAEVPLTEGLEIRAEPLRHVFVRPGPDERSTAVILAARIDLAASQPMSATRHLQRYLLANLHRSSRHFERLLADGAVRLTPSYRDGREALEMRHDGADGPLGVEEPAVRVLVVGGGDHLLVFALIVDATEGFSVDAVWQDLTASLVLDPPAFLSGRFLLLGGAGIAALLLLLLVLHWCSRRRRRNASETYHDAAASAWKQAMQAPELHPAGGPPAAGRSIRSSAAVMPERADRDAESSSPSSAVALGCEVPAPGAETLPDVCAGPGDAQDLLEAARKLVGRPPPPREGLRRTFSPDGRFSA